MPPPSRLREKHGRNVRRRKVRSESTAKEPCERVPSSAECRGLSEVWPERELTGKQRPHQCLPNWWCGLWVWANLCGLLEEGRRKSKRLLSQTAPAAWFCCQNTDFVEGFVFWDRVSKFSILMPHHAKSWDYGHAHPTSFKTGILCLGIASEK